MKKITAVLLIALFSVGAFAAGGKPKIGMAKAQSIASAKLPGLRLKAKELEKEKGRWIYSFEFFAGKGKVKEVNVDAYSGKVIGIENENAKKEAAEEKNEKKEKH